MGDRGDLVVLVGSQGFIGRLHADIYASLGVPFVGVDINGPGWTTASPPDVHWPDVIVDVCTPTAVHTESVRWAYGLGARRFLVEKPAGNHYVDWRSCLTDVRAARIFVGHSYMFSAAFQAMVAACPDVVSVTAAFDKDRAQDDLRLRGANAAGRLADVFQIEAPHAFSMVLALQPALELASARYTRYSERGPGTLEPTACLARFTHATLPEALAGSDLRRPRRRMVEVHGRDGRRVVAHFPLSAASPESSVRVIDAQGRSTTLLEGRDDLLRATLVAGLEAMRSGKVPWVASAHFAGVVLARIGEAARMARAGGAAATGPMDTQQSERVDAGAVYGH